MDCSLTKTIDLYKLLPFDKRDPSNSNSTMTKKYFFFFLYFTSFTFLHPVSDYLFHFMMMALNANEVIPGPIPVVFLAWLFLELNKPCGINETSAVGDIFSFL